MILGWFLLGVASFVQADLPTLSARGQAVVSAPADRVSFNVAVVTEGKTAAEALQSNRAKMSDVIKSFKELGIKEEDYQTGLFSIAPLFTIPPKDPGEEYIRSIKGYEVRNQLTVQTSQIDLVGKLFDAVTSSGANSIDSFQFSLSNTESIRLKAIEEAVLKGALEAKTAALAAGTKLRRIKEIQIDPDNRPQPVFKANFMMAEAATPIKSGNVEVSATVNLVYEIAE